VGSTHFRQDIPLFVIMRALGIESDRDIIERIVHDIDDARNAPLLQLLHPSLEECSLITTQQRALEYLVRYVQILGHPKEMRLDSHRKVRYVLDTLRKDLLPHVGASLEKKAYFVGRMVRKLLYSYLGYMREDDRDVYANKRVDTPGPLLTMLLRQYYSKMIKDMRNALVKEMNSGNWRYSNKISDLINQTNIYKIIKSSIIDGGMRYSMATGNWGMKNITSKGKIGIAQVLNRHSHSGKISHLRRISAPIDKTSKLTLPRKLNSTSFCYTDTCETPEGGAIGVVKNMAISCVITLKVDSDHIRRCIENCDRYPEMVVVGVLRRLHL
jgi:DNA-directed RNA polymerase II subunit RPB2